MKKILIPISVIYLITFIVLTILFFTNAINSLYLQSAIYAGLLNLINSIMAIFLFNYSLRKSNNIFLLANLGGMGVRLFFMLIAVIIFIKFLNIDIYGFILLFFIFYFLLLVVEVYFFNAKAKEKNSIKV